MYHSIIVSKSQGLTLPRTGDIGPKIWYYFAMSQDLQAGNLAHLVDARDGSIAFHLWNWYSKKYW